MSTQSDNRLRLVGQRQSWRIWDDAVVVFEPLSGDTHRIAPPGGRILALLAESESSRAALDSNLESVATKEEVEEALDLLLAMEMVESV